MPDAYVPNKSISICTYKIYVAKYKSRGLWKADQVRIGGGDLGNKIRTFCDVCVRIYLIYKYFVLYVYLYPYFSFCCI